MPVPDIHLGVNVNPNILIKSCTFVTTGEFSLVLPLACVWFKTHFKLHLINWHASSIKLIMTGAESCLARSDLYSWNVTHWWLMTLDFGDARTLLITTQSHKQNPEVPRLSHSINSIGYSSPSVQASSSFWAFLGVLLLNLYSRQYHSSAFTELSLINQSVNQSMKYIFPSTFL